jgi:Na+:H+ antiporter, NhaA family
VSPSQHADQPAPGGPPARLIRPLRDFLRLEASAGILLVGAATLALIWANSPWSETYFDLWGTSAEIGLGDHIIELNLREWVNDLGMVLFFFVVGLGDQARDRPRRAARPPSGGLPIIAAIGGMIVPATIFALLNSGGEGAQGWGIPMATDIAIVMGVVALLGSSVAVVAQALPARPRHRRRPRARSSSSRSSTRRASRSAG